MLPVSSIPPDTVKNASVRVTYYKIIVDTLPEANRTLLFAILPFLVNIIKYADINKMAIHNVATVFGPNMLQSSDKSAMAMIQGTSAVNAITCELLDNYEEIIEVRIALVRKLSHNWPVRM